MKIIVACDSFKGSCSSHEVAQAAAAGIREIDAGARVVPILIADGGEGTMRTLTQALKGQIVTVAAHNAVMRPIVSAYGVLPDGTAVIDMAETGGITRLQRHELDPMNATTFGLGEQIADAIRRGCSRMLIGLGGSATTDGGQGMIEALKRSGTDYESCRYQILCDVNNPLYGPQGAAYVFAPQKGADETQVALLDARLREQAARSEHPELAQQPGAGAAGGLGFAFLCYLHGSLISGIEAVLDYQHFDTVIRDADLVITGEGKMDRQTLMNKAPLGVLRHARKQGIPVVGIAGRVEDKKQLEEAGFEQIVCINPDDTPPEVAMQKNFAMAQIRRTVKTLVGVL